MPTMKKSTRPYREPSMYGYLHFSVYDLDMVPLKIIKDKYLEIKKKMDTLFLYPLDKMSMQCDYASPSFFAVNIPEDNGKISVYNTVGNLLLGEFFVNEAGLITTNDLSKIVKLCRNLDMGLVPCSKCKRVISRKRVAGHHFCSVFCKKCFTGTIKENAQNESYN